MKSAKIMMMGLAAALTLAGCSKDENETIDNWNGEIRLSSGVNTLTRAHGIDEQIAADQKVSVYVDDADDTKVYGKNNLKANGFGGFTDGATMYYPSNGKNVNIYAIHPAITTGAADDVFPAVKYEFAVKADQKSKADYAASDLLYSIKTGVTRSSSAVALTFYHLLSKVEVALKSGSGLPVLTGATVTIEGTKLKADFTPSKTADINNSTPGTAASARAAMITVKGSDNNAASIAIPTEVSSDDFGTGTSYAEAVIVPQTVANSTVFIKVQLASGTTYTYKLGAETTFESGKKYQYKITVNNSGLTVTSSIEDWTAVGAVTGNAEME